MVSSLNEFSKKSLIEGNLQSDPHLQFLNWLNEYLQMGVNDGIAMSFSTINSEGFPSSRIVFMRNCDENGFVFFTNYDSNKGKEIRENNKASILFYWPELERQIRVWGVVEKVEDDVI